MIDQTKNVDTGPSEVSVPLFLNSLASKDKNKLKDYRVRVERFDLGPDMDDEARLENLYTRGIDGSNDIVIIKEKSFTDKDVMIVMVFYMERRMKEQDPSEYMKSLRELDE